jgi:hypothetical protein
MCKQQRRKYWRTSAIRTAETQTRMHSGMHELHSLEHTLAHTHIHTQGWRLGQQDATTMTLMLASACPHMDSLTLSRCQLSMAPLRAQILGSRLTSLTIDSCSTADIRCASTLAYEREFSCAKTAIPSDPCINIFRSCYLNGSFVTESVRQQSPVITKRNKCCSAGFLRKLS